MPSLITHELFGKEVYRSLPSQLTKIIEANSMEFSIGTSGPDLFFYYNAWPWMNQTSAQEIARIGSALHQHHIHEFFAAVFQEVKAHQTQEKISYIAGLLCHWALDKEAHPYIFYQTESTISNHSSLYHRAFESHLDYLMLQLIRGITPKDYPGYKLLTYDQQSVDAITAVYRQPLKDVYHFDIDTHCISTCLKHFYGIQKVLYDPNGTRIKLYKQIETKLLHKPDMISSMVVPLCEDPLDILNNSKQEWHHPCTNKTSKQSFVECFNQAIPIAQDICTQFFAYLKNEIELDELLSIINNQSFETGLSIDSPMKHFNCIYERTT